ncbi:hydroxylysine kinase-like [Protopterus annectens]|uniref:hydroxylysine kinase-like n=1 Tax=Protopterus annectens TaxID=7888 RepID=UPI001CFB333B|nr:hydroxylysine kinase-like [Protopterus annectens]
MDFDEDDTILKPDLKSGQVIQLIEKIYDLHVIEIRELPSYCDQNFYIRVQKNETSQAMTTEYVVKIINSAESQKNADMFEVLQEIMKFLHLKGFPTPLPFPTKNGQSMSLESIDYGLSKRKHLVRLLTFLPGNEIKTVPVTSHILFEVGKMAALIDKVLKEKFHHPNIGSLNRASFIWKLSNFLLMEQYIYVLGQSKEREVVEQVILQFKEKIQPNLNQFRPCLNHGDFNEVNILLEPKNVFHKNDMNEQYRISGILDFDDMSYGCYVFEVAITIMYQMSKNKDPLSVGGYVLAGFESVMPLTSQERKALFLLVNCRLSQSIVLNRYNSLQCPDNKDYMMRSSETEAKLLLKLWNTGSESVEKIWFDIADSYAKGKNEHNCKWNIL